MVKFEFNEKELVFIERMVDNLISNNLQLFADLLRRTEKVGKDDSLIKQHMSDLIKENIDTYDFLRTLSYKSESMRVKK